MNNNKMQYRTFDTLLADVQTDFRKYHLEDLMNPAEYIKVVKRCNFELGLKLHSTKETILEVLDGKAKLPLNFQVMNFVFALGKSKVTYPVISGTHVEELPVSAIGYNSGVDQEGNMQQAILGTHLNAKGETFVLVQNLKYETKEWNEFFKIRLVPSVEVDIECPNKAWVNSLNQAYIKNNVLHCSFKTGEVYINYQSTMEDEEGNLLVPDHALLNEYYEYAVKKRILENLIMNGETVNQLQIQLIEQGYKSARNNSMSFVNTPDFDELRRIWEHNRKAQYSNYYDMFKRNA